MLTSETKRRIDACRDVLVGKLPLPTDQVELITLALIYKFMDDLDEESVKLGGKRSFFVKDLAPYRWRNLLPQTVSAEQRMTLFAEGIEALGHPKKGAHLPGLFRDIFRNAFLKFRDGRILTLFLTEANGFEYSHSEELGNAFEYLLQDMGTQGANGQFRTPRHIIDFIVACLDPQPGDKILDPACGTGGFLVSAFRHILAKHTDGHGRSGRDGRGEQNTIPGGLLSHAQRQAVYKNLIGYDITDLMVKLSKVNLFLHGFPDPAIHIYDTLSNDARWHERADLILANPPFMTPKGGVTPHTKFRIAAKKAEVLFTDYIAEHLSADGRGGVIVPNGIVATTQNAYVKLRRYLVEDSLVAVVSLPAGVFKPYSGVKTSILLLDKKLARTAKEILFLKITADGFDLGDKRTPIAANDLPEAERVVKLWLAGKLNEQVETPLAWKAVEKNELLESRAVSLQPEPYLGEGPQVGESSFVNVADLLCEVKLTNKIQKTQFLPSGRFPIIDQSENFIAGYWNDEADVFRVTEPLVLFGDHTRRFKYVDFDFVLGADGVKVLRFDERVLPRYAYFALSALRLRDLGYSRHYKELLGHEIPLPPLEEQRRIVAEIEGYQKVLDGARQILAGYRASFVTSPDWPEMNLSEVAYFQEGPGILAKDFRDDGVPLVRLAGLRNGKASLTGCNYLSPEMVEKRWSQFKLAEGDILVLTSATFGNPAVVGSETAGAIFYTGIIRFRSKSENLDSGYLKAFLGSPSFLQQAESLATGSVISHFGPSHLKQMTIPLPSLPEQRRIVSELDAEAAQVESVRALLPRFEAKIQRVLDRVWGSSE